MKNFLRPVGSKRPKVERLPHDVCAANYELCIMNYELINGYGIEDPGFALLREVAQKYCPEEAREARQSVLPDEALNLTALEAGFKQLLGGGSGYADLPYFGDPDDSRGAV